MTDEGLALLRSIDASLKVIAGAVKAKAPKAVAADDDLDGPYGDPVVKFDPRDWTGDSFKGAHFSACPPDYLELVAGAFDYFAKQAEEKHELTAKGKPVAEFKRADAARARGWAKRNRNGHKPTAPATPAPEPNTPMPEWGEGDVKW